MSTLASLVSVDVLPFPSLFSAIADQANLLHLSVGASRSCPAEPELTRRLTQDRKETYASTRSHAAEYMRAHPDDFLPFLESEDNADGIMSPGPPFSFYTRSYPHTDLGTAAEYARYCTTVQKTAEWGGEPEVRLAPLQGTTNGN